MESLSDLNLSSSLSEVLVCLYNLFAIFLCLFICLVVKDLSSNSSGCLGLPCLSLVWKVKVAGVEVVEV